MDSDPSHSITHRISSIISKFSITSLVILLAFTTNILLLTSHEAVAATTDGKKDIQEGRVSSEIKAPVEKEILWFARAIYSETKIPYEQNLVAWVIRNRVEAWQYPDTYEAVILQPNQFSGFNTNDPHYYTNMHLQIEDTLPGWETALTIAREVYAADPKERPISATVWHFYSPISASRTPSWALGVEPVHVVEDVATDTVRFAFFANVQ